jgi:hypothetical protein
LKLNKAGGGAKGKQMRKPVRTIIHLGSGEEGQARKEALERRAAKHGAISQRNEPSIGRLLVMLAEGELVIVPKDPA